MMAAEDADETPFVQWTPSPRRKGSRKAGRHSDEITKSKATVRRSSSFSGGASSAGAREGGAPAPPGRVAENDVVRPARVVQPDAGAGTDSCCLQLPRGRVNGCVQIPVREHVVEIRPEDGRMVGLLSRGLSKEFVQ